MKKLVPLALVASAVILSPMAAAGPDGMATPGAVAAVTSEIGGLVGDGYGAVGIAAGAIIGGAAGFFAGAYLGSLAGPGAVFVGLKGADIGAGLGAVVGGA